MKKVKKLIWNDKGWWKGSEQESKICVKIHTLILKNLHQRKSFETYILLQNESSRMRKDVQRSSKAS